MRIHRGRTARREIHRIDRVVGRVIARIVCWSGSADGGLVEPGSRKARRSPADGRHSARSGTSRPETSFQPRDQRGVILGAHRLPPQISSIIGSLPGSRQTASDPAEPACPRESDCAPGRQTGTAASRRSLRDRLQRLVVKEAVGLDPRHRDRWRRKSAACRLDWKLRALMNAPSAGNTERSVAAAQQR